MSIFTKVRNGSLLTEKSTYIDATQPMAIMKLRTVMLDLLAEKCVRGQDIVVFCIGTDRATGDSLGPLTGTALKKVDPPGVIVKGTLEKPVHAVNLEENYKQVKESYNPPFIIAIDACLGRTQSIGKLSVGAGSLKPGSGVNKKLPEIGDVYINGIVNVGGFLEHHVLQNTRLNIVVKLSELIVSGLYQALLIYNSEKTRVI